MLVARGVPKVPSTDERAMDDDPTRRNAAASHEANVTQVTGGAPPTQLAAPAPYPPAVQAAPPSAMVHVGPLAPIPSLPGMPPIPPMSPMPGVSVQVQNIVAPAPPMQPYPYAPVAPVAQVGAERPQGVVALMREDASQKAMEAVSRRGPARMLAYSVGAVMVATMVALLLLLPLGVPAFAVAVAEVPCLAIAVAAFVIGKRAGDGPGGHQLEQAILRVAAQNDGVFRVVHVAQATGRPLKECQLAIDAMVAAGHATVDADDRGGLVYRVPDLEPSHALHGARG